MRSHQRCFSRGRGNGVKQVQFSDSINQKHYLLKIYLGTRDEKNLMAKRDLRQENRVGGLN